MQRPEAVRLDRMFIKAADDKMFINLTFDQLINKASEELNLTVSYSEVKDAISHGGFTCASNRCAKSKKEKMKLMDRIDELEKKIQLIHEYLDLVSSLLKIGEIEK